MNIKVNIILFLFSSSLFAYCPYADCSSTSQQESQKVVDNIKSNAKDITSSMDDFEEKLDDEMNTDKYIIEELDKQINQLQENQVVLREIDSLLKKKIKLLKISKEKF